MTTIAIDGPGGAGKSTLARSVASRLGLEWLDTGAMYRAVTLLALRGGAEEGDEAALAKLGEMELSVGPRVVLFGEDVTDAIRSEQVSARVSSVAAQEAVRRELVARQRAGVAERGGGVVEGRDIGSVVLPDAELKIYLTAGEDERARRRAAEHPGEDGGDVASTRQRIAQRDLADSTRAISPLEAAPDAVHVDSTGRSPDEVAELVLSLLRAPR